MTRQHLFPLLLMTDSKLFALVSECFFGSSPPYCFLHSIAQLFEEVTEDFNGDTEMPTVDEMLFRVFAQNQLLIGQDRV